MDSVLRLTLANYHPTVLEMPSGLKIIDGDTLQLNDANYIGSSKSDSITIIHNTIVKKNALNFIPESKPYIDMVFNACNRHKGKFPVPSESVLGLLCAESYFDPFALSGARAWGMAQFLRGTARDFGLSVYSPEEFPKLYELEVRSESLTNSYYYNRKLVYGNLKAHDFDAVKKYTLISDSILIELKAVQKAFTAEIKRIGVKNIKDDRLIPEKIIPVCVQYIAGLAYQAKLEYTCSDEQAIDWAMEAYNGGYGNLKKDLPFEETYNHERRINKLESELFPRFVMSINASKSNTAKNNSFSKILSTKKTSSKEYWYYYNGANMDSVRFGNLRKF
jgi:hypothetical protein